MTIEFCLLVLIIILMYFRPSWLINFSRTILGKLVFVLLIIMCTVKNTMCGILAALLLICLSESVIEGLGGTKDTKTCKKCGGEKQEKKCKRCPNCKWDDKEKKCKDASGNTVGGDKKKNDQ